MSGDQREQPTDRKDSTDGKAAPPEVSDDIDGRIRRLAQGDADALEELLVTEYPRLRMFVRLKSGAVVRSLESSTDLVQSVCREALRDAAAGDFEDEAAFRQWLYTVTLNKIRRKTEHYRAQKRDVARDVGLDAVEGDPTLAQSYAATLAPSHVATSKEAIARIEAAFDELPDDYRDVITQVCIVGKSHGEVAMEHGKNEVAVRKLLSRARARLAIRLTEFTE